MRNPALKRLAVPLDEYRLMVRQRLAPHRLELIAGRAEWIRRTEAWIGRYLIAGRDVNVNSIQPNLELVTTERQHSIWRYCRLWGSIPYNRGCGRLLRYILRDEGQPNAPIMGIVALSSPVLINKPRDEWIGWTYPADLAVKRERLLSCMELSVSMAIAPYNHLTAGKLICLVALSNELRQDYHDKYHAVQTPSGLQEARLALITTTSLYGSSIQYNRLRVSGRLAYQHIGYSSGYGNAHLTEEEFAEMEQYLHEVGKPIPKGWGTGRSYRLRVYSAYYRRRHGEKHAPAHEHPRSIYVAPLATNCRQFLRKETDELDTHDLPLSKLVEDWRERWLVSRLSKPHVMERFRAAAPAENLLSKELEDSSP